MPPLRARQGALPAENARPLLNYFSTRPTRHSRIQLFPPAARWPQTCSSAKDCQSDQCLGGVCAFGPTCNNGIKDAVESDVDCGGINSGCLPCCWSERERPRMSCLCQQSIVSMARACCTHRRLQPAEP